MQHKLLRKLLDVEFKRKRLKSSCYKCLKTKERHNYRSKGRSVGGNEVVPG